MLTVSLYTNYYSIVFQLATATPLAQWYSPMVCCVTLQTGSAHATPTWGAGSAIAVNLATGIWRAETVRI
jgi:hypothetical protein